MPSERHAEGERRRRCRSRSASGVLGARLLGGRRAGRARPAGRRLRIGFGCGSRRPRGAARERRRAVEPRRRPVAAGSSATGRARAAAISGAGTATLRAPVLRSHPVAARDRRSAAAAAGGRLRHCGDPACRTRSRPALSGVGTPNIVLVALPRAATGRAPACTPARRPGAWRRASARRARPGARAGRGGGRAGGWRRRPTARRRRGPDDRVRRRGGRRLGRGAGLEDLGGRHPEDRLGRARPGAACAAAGAGAGDGGIAAAVGGRLGATAGSLNRRHDQPVVARRPLHDLGEPLGRVDAADGDHADLISPRW